MNKSAWQVLVVEDEQDSVQIVSDMLRYHDIEVYVARNGRECLTELKNMNPTLVVMDLAMPEMDGWDTLEAMRTNPVTAHIPVVARSLKKLIHNEKVPRDPIM